MGILIWKSVVGALANVGRVLAVAEAGARTPALIACAILFIGLGAGIVVRTRRIQSMFEVDRTS